MSSHARPSPHWRTGPRTADRGRHRARPASTSHRPLGESDLSLAALPPTVIDRSAVVLAGGFSTRYGETDKTLAEIDGRPMIAHAVRALRPVVDDIVVSCRESQLSSFRDALDGVRYRPDETPDQGPLAGLSDALGGVEGDTLALTTADMPRVPAALYRECFDRREWSRATPSLSSTRAIAGPYRRCSEPRRCGRPSGSVERPATGGCGRCSKGWLSRRFRRRRYGRTTGSGV
ncbi:NTP transferase domain-containing protein [Halapricum sp. CBA1109]|nr:NTP transferase domain-containing protein [Halapricum sp. CBA1109]